jgi:hypothetical protein
MLPLAALEKNGVATILGPRATKGRAGNATGRAGSQHGQYFVSRAAGQTHWMLHSSKLLMSKDAGGTGL